MAQLREYTRAKLFEVLNSDAKALNCEKAIYNWAVEQTQCAAPKKLTVRPTFMYAPDVASWDSRHFRWRYKHKFLEVLNNLNHILDIYRVLYNKGMNTSQAVEYLEEEMPATDERDEIVTFIRESGRGIIKRFTKGSNDDDLPL